MTNSEQTAVYDNFDHSEIILDGLRIHYVEAGSGPVMVLIHGSPVSSFSFRYQIAALSSEFRVIAPDLPGFGRSEAPERGADFEVQARTLESFFEHLNFGPFRLVVHDWGGPIGLAAASGRVEQIRKLVLMNTTVRPDFEPPIYWKVFTAPYLGDLLLVKLQAFRWGLPVMLEAARSSEVRGRYSQPLQREASRRTVLALERLTGYEEIADRLKHALADLTAEVLILWGDPDPYFRTGEFKHLTGMFPDASVRKIPRGGHFPQEDAPEGVTSALVDFMSDR